MNTENKRSESASHETPMVTPIVKPVESKKSESKLPTVGAGTAGSSQQTDSKPNESNLGHNAPSWIDEVSSEALAFENRLQELVRQKPLIALAGAAVAGFVVQSILTRRSHES